MVKIKKVRPKKIGNSYFYRIPKQFITNGIIDETEMVDLQILKRG